MPNDAKFGLAVGVGLLIVVAVVFFHKDLTGTRLELGKSAASVTPPPAPRRGAPGNSLGPVPARTASVTSEGLPGRTHPVQEGEALPAGTIPTIPD